MQTKTILLSVCLAVLLAVPAMCAPPPVYSFMVERTDDGSTPGIWVYTLHNDSNQPISLDSWGVFGSTASSLAGVDPAPAGWSICTDDPVDPDGLYPDYWQVTWTSGLDNVPGSGDSVAGFTIQASAGAAPTQFEFIYFDDDHGLEPQYFTDNIQNPGGVPEPSTLASLAAAFPCLGVAAFRRRRFTPNC